MKILHLIDTLGPGGKERQLVELLKGLQKNKSINCELGIFNRPIHYKEIYQLGIKVHFLHKDDNDHFPVFIKLFRICKAVKPDIIHTWGFKQTRYAILIAKLLNIKLLNGFIRYATPIKKFDKIWWCGRLTFPFSDMVVANSKAGLETHNLKESPGNRYVYNGFNFDRINKKSSASVKTDIKLGANYVVGMVANFLTGKDHQTLIQAGLKILEKRKGIVFLFIGDGPTRKNMENIIKQEFKNHFLFLGRRTDVEEIVKIIDVGVLLSRAGHSEGISNAIMEYMALSKPVIATDTGGNRELILDGETGFLIPHQNIDVLIDKLNFLFNNPGFREEMGQRGEERIKKVFSIEKMISNYIKIYKDLVRFNNNQE